MKTLFNYLQIPGTTTHPDLRKRFFTPDEVASTFGAMPHVEAKKGRTLETDSGKELYVFGDKGEELIAKKWDKDDPLAVKSVVHELVGRRLVTEISKRGIALKDSKLSVPGAIGYTTDEGVFLVTGFCGGNPLDTENINAMPVDLRSKAAACILLSSVETFPSSSGILNITDDKKDLSIIDLESLQFSKCDLPQPITLVLLGMLAQASINEGKGEDFVKGVYATGIDWKIAIPKAGRDPLIQALRTEIGEPTLGDVTLGADEIVEFLIKLSNFYYDPFKFNLWQSQIEAQNDKSKSVSENSELRELAQMGIDEINIHIQTLTTQSLHLRNGTTGKGDTPHIQIRRAAHTLKAYPRIFGEKDLEDLHDVAHTLELLAIKNRPFIELEPLINLTIEEAGKGREYIRKNFMSEK